MPLIVQLSDFTGDNAIATDVFTQNELQLAIDANEKTLIYELLGIELAAAFITNLSNYAPVDPIYLEFFNPFIKEINTVFTESKGMKQMLDTIIFFEYVRKQSQTNTIQGNTQVDGNLNMPSAMNWTTLTIKYNDAIKTFRAIQDYIKSNKTTYPTFKGIYKEYMSWA